MFKTTSNNMQSRDRRAVTEHTGNTAGIDESVWKPNDETRVQRADLVAKKQKLEIEISRLNANIAEAQIRRGSFNHGRAVRVDHLADWHARKAELVREMQSVEAALSKIRLAMSHRKPQEDRTFERTFMVVAKEMLAEPVYQRIITATLHRAAEQDAE